MDEKSRSGKSTHMFLSQQMRYMFVQHCYRELYLIAKNFRGRGLLYMQSYNLLSIKK